MTKSLFFQEKLKYKENLHLYLCAHVTSFHPLQFIQVEVLWQSRATRLWSLLWRWVRLLSILSHHSIFRFCLRPLAFVSGLGGHWDAEHCQGAAEGADKDWGSVSLQTLKILTLCIYVPSQFCPPEFKPFTILNHVVWSLSVLKARIPTILVPWGGCH